MDRFIQRQLMIDYTNRWMFSRGQMPKDWPEIEALEGGKGEGRCRTIEDALSCGSETWPNLWFASNQTYLLGYQRYDYIYSLMWAFYEFSHRSYDLICSKWSGDVRDKIVCDVGGSLYSAVSLLEHGAQAVYVYNLLGTPQTDIILDFTRRYGVPIYVSDNYGKLSAISHTLIMKAYLEHFRSVDVEMSIWLDVEAYNGVIITDNSFCEIAYGHYIPIHIAGLDTKDQETADMLFEDLMHSYGYEITSSVPKRPGSPKRIKRFARSSKM